MPRRECDEVRNLEARCDEVRCDEGRDGEATQGEARREFYPGRVALWPMCMCMLHVKCACDESFTLEELPCGELVERDANLTHRVVCREGVLVEDCEHLPRPTGGGAGPWMEGCEWRGASGGVRVRPLVHSRWIDLTSSRPICSASTVNLNPCRWQTMVTAN